MKTRSALLLFAVCIALSVWLISRQRALLDLQAANEVLRQEIEARGSVFANPPPGQTDATNAPPELSAEEERELLRLRGQINPLRREFKELTNRLELP